MNATRKNLNENRHFEKEEGSSRKRKKNATRTRERKKDYKNFFQHQFLIKLLSKTIK